MKHWYIKSYPKINIGLNVYPKNNDNKHRIISIFMLIDQYYDEIEIYESKISNVFYINNNKKYIIQNDTVSKIMNFLYEKKKIKNNYTINIYKNIPQNAGLGGSSANAGSILDFFIKNQGIVIDFNDLKEIALNIGSDIPFFASKYEIALVCNYGDEIYDLSYLKKPKIKLVQFFWDLSTKEIYEKFDTLPNIKIKQNDYKYIIKNWSSLNNIEIHNNLLLPALLLSKDFFNFYQDMKKSDNVTMTGSGAFIYKIIGF